MDLPVFTHDVRIAVIGLGYVGLPLAVTFGQKYPTVGFDKNAERISDLRNGNDMTLEVEKDTLASAMHLSYSSDINDIRECNFYIIAVPTPIDGSKRPDLNALVSASTTVGSVLRKNDFVIYESTVYPGATEEVCVPILEKESSLVYNSDFYCGYSPERINPGDKEHRLTNIVKITSGSNAYAADIIDALYSSIITAGTWKTSSIRVAEAAKVIENTQRDVNIALINELSLIFNKLSLNTTEILEAAGTKWNFLKFQPGLVGGGHCIGVDPYYLTFKAQEVGFHPNIVLAGRRLNDGMGQYIVAESIKLMLQKKINVSCAKVLIMGLSFKENCPDIRNTRVIDIIKELDNYGVTTDIYDPWVSAQEAQREYNISITSVDNLKTYDALIVCVSHRQFVELSHDQLKALGNDPFIIFDVKNIYPLEWTDGRL